VSLSSWHLLRRAAAFVQSVLEVDPILPWLDRRYSNYLAAKIGSSQGGPLLIVGAPRSGTTVLYQLIVSQFQVAYVCNLAALLYRAPVIATRLARAHRGAVPFTGASEYGYVAGIRAPSEAGAFFQLWTHVACASADDRRRRSVQRAAQVMAELAGGPLVLKNLNATFYWRTVLRLFPEARFIRVRRDAVETADSILRARRALWGNQSAWFGPKPPELEGLASLVPPYEAIARQLAATYTSLDALQSLHAERVYDLEYEALATDPAAELSGLARWLQEQGFEMHPRHIAPPVAGVAKSCNSLDPVEQEALRKALREAGGSGTPSAS